MRIRAVLLIIVLFLGSGILLHLTVQNASTSPPFTSTVLSQINMRGSMQGQSGIALDVNGDGTEDLIVGAPQEANGNSRGAILVYPAVSRSLGFLRDNDVFGVQLHPATVVEGDGNLGWSLAALGNVAGRGKGFFAAGAFNGSGKKSSLSGTVTIFHRSGANRVIKDAVLEGEDALDKFGYVLAAGDLNGDGTPDLIIGAPFNSPMPALYQQGAVYIYFGPDYDPARAIKIPATTANGGLGFSVAAGDINGDGIDDLLIGASGKVLVFYGSNTFSPDPQNPDVVFSSTDAGFGHAICVLRDVDGDGIKDLAVGADQATIADAANSGRVFIIRGGWPKGVVVNADTTSLAKIDGEANSGRFGSFILPLGDMNADSVPDLAVSAVHADGSAWPMTGKIYVFSGKDLLDPGLSADSAKAFAGEAKDMHFGTFMSALAGKRQLVAGAPTENENTGAVHILNLK